MTIYELVKILNKYASSPEFVAKLSKIHTHEDFHKLVRNEFYQLVRDYNLNIGIWEIYLGSNRQRTAITYNRTFKKYKNCKWTDKGNFSDLIFQVKKGYAQVVVSELLDYIRKEERREQIEILNKGIEEHEAAANALRKELADLYKETA